MDVAAIWAITITPDWGITFLFPDEDFEDDDDRDGDQSNHKREQKMFLYRDQRFRLDCCECALNPFIWSVHGS